MQEIFSYVEKSVMGELRMIGQFNKGLKKELFEKTRVNVKLSKMVIPSITTLWLFTTGKHAFTTRKQKTNHCKSKIQNYLHEKGKIGGSLYLGNRPFEKMNG